MLLPALGEARKGNAKRQRLELLVLGAVNSCKHRGFFVLEVPFFFWEVLERGYNCQSGL